MITIVNYGMGNLGSVLNMFKKVGVEAKVTDNLNEIADATKILLPGVGAFDAAMSRIKAGGFEEILNKKALEDKVPVLGICLGMQLLTDCSEEGVLPGLGWIKGKTIKFSFTRTQNLKVPHMGWNLVKQVNASPLIADFPPDPRFYFVHSYFVKADEEMDVLMRTTYGHEFDSVITNGENIFGAQFHPEKSHKFGMKLFKNFSEL
ncbi:imidazole glycerol phosphate synthase subunit HisH [Adhaeribacter soli]|uniref:Imidazole glycerol phosphate synthase subunit HisH n=1 Tax=Adhaeribacter soli TaxID=2607655 RepID=A0A5N1IL37_9BACT|nr:imidazole glycerol phosphate synthase subunit HisH [Adhaeribacter soli]KAA9327404.1 imidazole glycerol phosphate synthase subunit HisH [Adhaeribacter soli]